MDDGSRGLDGEALLAQIRQWSADERARQAAGSRRRRRWLRQQANEATTIGGLLLAVAERGAAVAIGTVAGVHRGTVATVTSQLCCLNLDQPGGGVALVPLSAITSVETRAPQVAGESVPDLALDLGGVLAALAAEPARLHLALLDGNQTAGWLVGTGADLVTVRPDSDPSTLVYVPLRAIAVCVLPEGPPGPARS